MSMPNCNTADNRQLHKIYCYNLFISCAITIVAQIAFIDRLLLRMDIDLGMFGFVKSIMFLLPAVIYQASSGFMQKLDRDVKCVYLLLFAAAFDPAGATGTGNFLPGPDGPYCKQHDITAAGNVVCGICQ